MAASWLKTRSGLVSKLLGIGAASILSFRVLSTENLARENEKQLVSVVMFTRHGARTPIFLISGIEQVSWP